MKSLTVKMLISLAAMALAAPFFALALLVGARAAALAHSSQENLLLVAFAFGGAAVSVLNGFGRRAGRSANAGAATKSAPCGVRLERVQPDYQSGSQSASMIYPGY